MAKSRKPKNVVVEPYRARAIRGPHKDGSGRWYWRVELYRGQKGAAVSLGVRWMHRADVEDWLRTMGGEEPQEGTRDATVTTLRDLLETFVAAQQARADIGHYRKRNVRRASQRILGVFGTPVPSQPAAG